MASVRRWTAIQKAVSSKLDEAEAAWQLAKQELAALKDSLPHHTAPGIEASYARLAASADVVKRRNSIYVKFEKRTPARTFTMEALLGASYRESRSTETIEGQLFRIFEAAQDRIDDMEAKHELFEKQVDAKLAKLREEVVRMSKDLWESGIAVDVTALETAEKILHGFWERHREVVGSAEMRELGKTMEDALERFAAVAEGRGVVEYLHLVMMKDLARLGFGMARQMVMTEFVTLKEVAGGTSSAVDRRGASSSKQEQRARQRAITEFFEVQGTNGVAPEPIEEAMADLQVKAEPKAAEGEGSTLKKKLSFEKMLGSASP